MILAMVLATAYVLGSIPTSYIVVHLITGRDIRSIGTGNPGTMNVWEHVGVRPALLVAFGDIGKGMAAVGIAYLAGLHDRDAVLAALMVVAGHDFSIFLRFHGGNGTAAAVGGLFALVPAATLPAAGLAFVLFLMTGSKRRSGAVGLLLVPALAYFIHYPDVKIVHMLVDAAATHLCLNPRQFDVMVMENMFGDILSDQGGGIIGSLGLMPSACLGDAKAYYEPSHGSAPDIAGRGVANPYSMIGSAAMMLEHSFGMAAEARAIWAAMQGVFAAGYSTPDLAQPGGTARMISTTEFGDRVVARLREAPVST